MGAFWDINKQKQERNREITNILVNQAMHGWLDNLESGTPVYEGFKSQFGEQFTKGLANQNRGEQEKRVAATKQARRKAVVDSFDNGTKIFDTAMKVRKMVGEKADPLVSEYLKVAQKELANAGIMVDFNPALNEVELREELGKKTMTSMVEKIEQFKSGEIDLMDLKIANVKYKGLGLSGPGHKELIEGVDKIIANAEKVKAADLANTQKIKAAKLKEKNIRERPRSDMSDLRFGWLMKRQEPGMENLTIGQYKRLYYTKPTPEPGKLTEKAVLEDIRELANYDPKKSDKLYGEYRELIKSGMSREDALNELKQRGLAGPTGTSYKHLWE
jgi:hypothetical protein